MFLLTKPLLAGPGGMDNVSAHGTTVARDVHVAFLSWRQNFYRSHSIQALTLTKKIPFVSRLNEGYSFSEFDALSCNLSMPTHCKKNKKRTEKKCNGYKKSPQK